MERKGVRLVLWAFSPRQIYSLGDTLRDRVPACELLCGQRDDTTCHGMVIHEVKLFRYCNY